MTDQDESNEKPYARNVRHGAYAYKNQGRLPARLEPGFDKRLARELLDHAGGDPAYAALAESAARRATILECAYSWLGHPDVRPFWLEQDDGGRSIVKMQPILRVIGSFHEGLRRDLAELGLTPVSAAKLGLPSERGAIDYEELLARQAAKEREAGQESVAEAGNGDKGDDSGESEDADA